MSGGPNTIVDSDGNTLHWDSLKGEWLPEDQLSPEIAIEESEPDFEAMVEARDHYYGGHEAEKREAMGVDGW